MNESQSSLPILPIDPFLPEILKGIQSHQNLILSAAPGSGKTTHLPPALAEHFKGKIWVLEPRRMAAIAAANRIAQEQNWILGDRVGYQVRLGSRFKPQTQLVFMTEALLTRHLLKDSNLEEVDIVVLDEFHERSIHVDLALGILRELQELGSKIKIIVMSATLDSGSLAKYFGSTALSMTVPGNLKELKIHYSKTPQLLSINSIFFDQCLRILREAVAASERDILFFLPGTGEIKRLQNQLQSWAEEKNIEILPLHGSLSLEEQTRALQRNPKGRRRIILSTNVAESSVTVDGVDVVIDSGLARQNFFDPQLQFESLNIKRISKSSAKQRAGRAARQFNGTCFRMWTLLDEASMIEMETPEIQRTDLTETLLYLSALGVPDATHFSWYMAPPPLLLQSGYQTLRQIGAIDPSLSKVGNLTEIGKQLLLFPLSVRLARVLLESHRLGFSSEGAMICALLQEKDFLSKDHDWGSVHEDCDLTYRLEIIKDLNNRGSRWQQDRTIQSKVAMNIREVAQDLIKCLAVLSHNHSPSPSNSHNPNHRKSPEAPLHFGKNLTDNHPSYSQLLLPAFSDRVCRRRKGTDRAVMVGGRGFKLAPQSVVNKSEFFIALAVIDTGTGSDSLITMATPLTKQEIENVLGNRIQKQTEVFFDSERGKFYRKEFFQLEDLSLDDGVLTSVPEDELNSYWPEIFLKNFEWVLRENSELAHFWERLQFLKEHSNDLPILENKFIEPFFKEEWDRWKIKSIEEAVYGENSWNSILKKDLCYFFENNLPVEIKNFLKMELPGKIQVPSQSWIPIHYQPGKSPFIEVRIQEIFGWETSPNLFLGKMKLSFHLLGPNFRPVQITNDLASFWKNAYAEVRKELRLKYPKHQWPEDPREGVAEAKGRRRPSINKFN